MQTTKNILLIFCLMLSFFSCFAQKDSSQNLPPVDVNFLFNYYNQDGNHSAVTGGNGTEKLQDFAQEIIINVPLDTSSAFNFFSHLNYYTSASTDRIDENRSSASSNDVRFQVQLGYSKNNFSKRTFYDFFGGTSIESDLMSIYFGGKWLKISKDENREFAISAKTYLDTWALIYPDELRKENRHLVATDKRRSFSLGFTYAQIINEKMQGSFSSEIIYQNGLLSTPFHRVYFIEQELPKVEKLPLNRFKIPFSFRLNTYLTKHLIARFYYRYYWDSFQIKAHTFDLELPFKLFQNISFYPFYRYYSQSQAAYFSPFKSHNLTEIFYTSDFDLSAFESHKFGLGFRYAPIWGFLKNKPSKKNSKMKFKSMGLRCSKYFRSDELENFIVSSHFSFLF